MTYENDYLLISQESDAADKYKAGLTFDGDELVLTNGLCERRFITKPDFACVGLKNLLSGEQFLRSVEPEVTLTLDGVKYPVGGVSGQFERAFIKKTWYDRFGRSEGFTYDFYETVPLTREFGWKKVGHSSDMPFPPAGICLKVHFKPSDEKLAGISVAVCYELYDGIPACGKFFELENNGAKDVRLNEFEAERLALTEHITGTDENGVNNLTSHSRDIFFTSSIENAIAPTFRFSCDPDYTSQVDYLSKAPVLLVSKPPVGPYELIGAGGRFTSYTANLLLFDDSDVNRRQLQICRLYRTLAPWTAENPIYLHVVSDDPETIKASVDQCADAGFEMIILSFGSGLNMEDVSEENIAKYKAIADYAHSKGIRLGGYSLLASRNIDSENNVVSDNIIFGSSPCLGSEWGIRYMKNLREFIIRTGFDVLEHDGSYPGDTCASEKHPGHRCYEDSQYTQLMTITSFYHECRERGVYLTVPDYYFLAGNTKCGMGYKEVNWSLPREQQRIIERQNVFDGTYTKLPSMGWMFVPLTEYHGGGAAATIEPLCEHIGHYRMMLAGNLLAGVQASYRGKRLYDTEETRAMVKSAVSDYKAHREIFESPALHLRRPDGRDWDGYLHVNPSLDERAMLVLFNPLDHEITRTLEIPLYYAGIENRAAIARFGENPERFELSRSYTVKLTVKIGAEDYVWYTVKSAD